MVSTVKLKTTTLNAKLRLERITNTECAKEDAGASWIDRMLFFCVFACLFRTAVL